MFSGGKEKYALATNGLSSTIKITFLQEQLPERVIQKYFSGKLSEIHRKAPLMDSFFLKKAPVQVSPCEFCKVFRNTFYIEHLLTSVFMFYFK